MADDGCAVTLLCRGPKTTPNPKIPKKRNRVYANVFEKFARTFAFFPVTQVRNPTEIVQKNLFRQFFLFFGGFFRVDFPPLIMEGERREGYCISNKQEGIK